MEGNLNLLSAEISSHRSSISRSSNSRSSFSSINKENQEPAVRKLSTPPWIEKDKFENEFISPEPSLEPPSPSSRINPVLSNRSNLGSHSSVILRSRSPSILSTPLSNVNSFYGVGPVEEPPALVFESGSLLRVSPVRLISLEDARSQQTRIASVPQVKSSTVRKQKSMKFIKRLLSGGEKSPELPLGDLEERDWMGSRKKSQPKEMKSPKPSLKLDLISVSPIKEFSSSIYEPPQAYSSTSPPIPNSSQISSPLLEEFEAKMLSTVDYEAKFQEEKYQRWILTNEISCLAAEVAVLKEEKNLHLEFVRAKAAQDSMKTQDEEGCCRNCGFDAKEEEACVILETRKIDLNGLSRGRFEGSGGGRTRFGN